VNTRKYVVGLCLFVALAATPIFAANPFEFEAAKVGQVNLNLGVSLGWGVGADVGADFILGKFDIKHFPMEWGIGVRGLAEFGFWGGFDWGAAGLWTLHKGFSFGNHADFDVYVGVGAGVGGYTDVYWGQPFGVGFATFDGIAWGITKNLWLQLEYGGVYGWNVSTSVASIGIRLNL